MATVKIKYVGAKQSESAFNVETGIVWTPGAVESVDLKHVAVMLKHPDVFALVDEPQSMGLSDKAKPKAEPVTAKAVETDETPAPAKAAPTPTLEKPAEDLGSIGRKDLHALAKSRGIKVHHTSGAAKVIEALQAANPTKTE